MTALTVKYDGFVRTVGTKLTTTAATAVYDPDDDMRPVVLAINVANTSGSAATVTLTKYDADAAATTFAIVSGYSIAANSRLTITDLPIEMSNGDELRATAGTASVLEVLVTVMESPGRFRAPG